MAARSIFPSAASEKRWLLAMKKSLILHDTVDMPFCVFGVPKPVSEAKPEAYAPRQLGLGPLHHRRPNLYATSNRKLAVVAKFLPPEKRQNFQLVVDALVRMEPVIRACYDQYLDLDIETLAWMLAIDGLYLLQLLKNYPEMKHFSGDVVMLENQIPLVVLKEILQVVGLSRKSSDWSVLTVFEAFLEDQSPLELNRFVLDRKRTDAHLLDRMHFLIVSNRGEPYSMGILEDLDVGLRFLADRGLAGAGTAGQIVSFVSAIPWGRISEMMIGKDGHDPSTSADEIEIPSVSQMSGAAGIRFVLGNDVGIRDINFDGTGNVFYLPKIRITATTEIVLRNLMAYEDIEEATAKSGAVLELAEYVRLMCGFIDSRRDVEILREAGIVCGEMDDEEIACIFNGISKSEKTTEKFQRSRRVEEAVDGVNARYNSLLRVKLSKMAVEYGHGCLKVMRVAATIVVVVLLTLQAYCSVFGCSRWFGKSPTKSVNVFKDIR